MKEIATIFNREIKAFFNSAIAYIFIVVFLLISVGLFMAEFFVVSNADMRWLFFIMPVVLCVFIPAITMRLWAEDRKGNTLELLLTFPMKTYQLVLGKFLASLAFLVTALISTLTVPIMIMILGNPDMGIIICQYIGSILLGSFFLALGIFVSGFCKDQIVSFILSMMACFAFFLMGHPFIASSIDGWLPGLGSLLRISLGMTQHFVAFQKGVIDSRDILYFAIGSAIFLILNGFWLDTRLKPKSKTVFTTSCLISAGIFTLINAILSDIPIGRFDFTEGKMYTVSESSRDILENLQAPVTAKLFISSPDKMPSDMKTLERDIRDKLDEFKIAAKGKFDYKVFHMEAANVAGGEEETLEKSIEKKGIRPFQVRSIEADEVGVKLIYSAMSLAYKEKPEDIIPQIMPGNMLDLEYTVISKIYRMTLDKKPSVALVAPYIEKTVDPKMKEILKSLGQAEIETFKEDRYEFVPKLLEYEGYKVSRIKLTEDEPVPEGTDTLVVLEPKEFNERQRFEINRFLVNGGSVFIGVQQYLYQYMSFGPQGIRVNIVDRKPEINPLLKEWGLGISDKMLMDTQADVVNLSGGTLLGIFEVSSPVKLPIQIKINSEQMNKDLSIASRLSTLFYLWGSALTIDSAKLKELNLNERVIFTTSRDAWEAAYHPGDLTGEDLTPPGRDKRASFPLCVIVEGEFPDAFKGKATPEWPKEEGQADASYEKKKEELNLTPKAGKLILTGCSEMFNKDLLGKGGHVPFFMNSIDALTLGEKLIVIRSKLPINRALKRISQAARAFWKIFVTFFVPIIICVTGAMRIVMRKRLKWTYLKTV